MFIHKLNYLDTETAIADLIAKGVYIETEQGLSYGQGIQAIVEIGTIILTDGTYDEEGNMITDPVFAEGYHFDVMSENEIEFDNVIAPNNPKHQFAGYE
jgi:hypothetical protein